jgi:hypothetical protein
MASRVLVDEPVATVANRSRPCFRRSAACLARPRRMARERGVVSGPGGPDGSGTPDPYRDGGGLSAAGGRCVGHRPSFATPCRGEACLARPRRMAREQERFAALMA